MGGLNDDEEGVAQRGGRGPSRFGIPDERASPGVIPGQGKICPRSSACVEKKKFDLPWQLCELLPVRSTL